MKRILSFLSIIAISVSSWGQSPGVYTILAGGTNNVVYATTNALGATFAVSEHEYVGIQVSAAASASTVGVLTFRFASSLDGTTYETTPQHVIPITLADTTVICKVTNVFVPGIATMKLVGIENTCTNGYATNVTVKWRVKSPKVSTR